MLTALARTTDGHINRVAYDALCGKRRRRRRRNGRRTNSPGTRGAMRDAHAIAMMITQCTAPRVRARAQHARSCGPSFSARARACASTLVFVRMCVMCQLCWCRLRCNCACAGKGGEGTGTVATILPSMTRHHSRRRCPVKMCTLRSTEVCVSHAIYSIATYDGFRLFAVL